VRGFNGAGYTYNVSVTLLPMTGREVNYVNALEIGAARFSIKRELSIVPALQLILEGRCMYSILFL